MNQTQSLEDRLYDLSQVEQTLRKTTTQKKKTIIIVPPVNEEDEKKKKKKSFKKGMVCICLK